MSCRIIRVQKMSAGSVKGIEIHDNRAKDVSHTNKDIDFSKSEQNYNLHEPKNDNFQKAVKSRIDGLELKKAVRKDAKVMCQALVTSDKAFFDGISKERQEQYFRDSYDFLCERFGKENIISATVHLDEKTPHMHVNFVPVTADGRLSAKDVIGGRNDLNKRRFLSVWRKDTAWSEVSRGAKRNIRPLRNLRQKQNIRKLPR